VKKLLLIQQDSAYFLHETLQMLEKSRSVLKEYELTVYANPLAWAELQQLDCFPLVKYVCCNQEIILTQNYDISVNLSQDENSWMSHEQIRSDKKIGPRLASGQLLVNELWSTYLMTLRGGAPFLTFHLQEIYRRILGINKLSQDPALISSQPKVIVIANLNPVLISLDDQQKIFSRLNLELQLPVKRISEIDLISDLTQHVYIGPATLEAINLCEQGATGIFLTSRFQGMNLTPYHGKHHLISADGSGFEAHWLYPLLNKLIQGEIPGKANYPVYTLEQEHSCGPYWKSHGVSDEHYPIYQSHLVLWNFLLNLQDVTLDVITCSEQQKNLVNETAQVLRKLLRLHDYALASLDIVLKEIKSQHTKFEVIDGHLANIREMDQIFNQLAGSNPLLRPVLDFYRIRKAQVADGPLLNQAQDTFLTYHEEHHALAALDELFSVTLRKNEVNI
jgi:hypothetical protein